MGSDPHLSPCTYLSSKCPKDLNTIPTILNLLKDKVQNMHQIRSTDGRTPVSQEIKPSINKWSLMKLKCIFTVKNTLIQIKKQPVEQENVFQPYI